MPDPIGHKVYDGSLRDPVIIEDRVVNIGGVLLVVRYASLGTQTPLSEYVDVGTQTKGL